MKLSFLIALTLTACVADTDEAEQTQELSTYRIKLFYSDPEMTQIVGERSALCTSTTNWGVRTPYVYQEAGDCMAPAPQNYPAWGNPCTCCQDYNGNGTCDPSEEHSFTSCSSSFNCR